jgi:hypothetical protein
MDRASDCPWMSSSENRQGRSLWNNYVRGPSSNPTATRTPPTVCRVGSGADQ